MSWWVRRIIILSGKQLFLLFLGGVATWYNKALLEGISYCQSPIYWTKHMINEKTNNMSCEIQGKTYYSRHESCVIRFTKSYYFSKRSLQPSNNRLKLTAHLAKILSARSLAWVLDGLKPIVIRVAIDYVLMGEANYYIVGKTNISVVLGGSGDLI